MRASTGQVQEALLETVEAARSDAIGRIARGAERASATIDVGAAAIAEGVDRVVEQAPTIDLEVRHHRRRVRPIVVVVILAAVAVVVGLSARRSRGAQRSTTDDGPPADGAGGSDGAVDAVDAVDPPDGADGTDARVRTFDIVPAAAGGWDIQGPSGVLDHHGTQAAAIEAAAALARDGGGEVVIHGRDGKPRDTRRYNRG